MSKEKFPALSLGKAIIGLPIAEEEQLEEENEAEEEENKLDDAI